MSKQRTSYAFLMEMLWVCGFFALSACIFVLAFVKADRLSKSAEDLNHAVLAAENAVETAFAGYNGAAGPDEILSGFDQSWNICAPDAPETAYLIRVNSHVEEGMLHVSACVSKAGSGRGEDIYTLSGCRSLAAERRLP